MKSFFLLMLAATAAVAQPPQVPNKMQFAGMTLTIREDARREIQKDVDALTQSPKHFMIKVERARTYFPIIEKVFREERLPEDFKYLVLQESALIPDAVSVSNAVGFWQFKDFTAEEVGLRVDKEVDERMNIVSSSRGAARYLKKNNFYFNNWLYALQAYQMGAGGVMRSVKDYESGATQMEVTGKTYWYVKKYLAHKIAFQGAVEEPGSILITAYESNGKSSISQLAAEYEINEVELQDYNRWVRKGVIPDDKVYAVIVPRPGEGPLDGEEGNTVFVATGPKVKSMAGRETSTSEAKDKSTSATMRINGLTASKAREGESASGMARRLGMKTELFLKYNDMSYGQKMEAGEYYFSSRKRARGEESFHKVEAGESLWSVSQQHGIKLKKLRRFNRLDQDEEVEAGTMLYLASKRPRSDKAEPLPDDVLEVDRNSVFSWSANPTRQPARTSETMRDDETEIVVTKTEVVVPETPASVKLEEKQPASTPVSTSESVVENVRGANDGMHIVGQGETMYSIAKTYDISVNNLAVWNNISTSDPIHEGQELRVAPPSLPTADTPGKVSSSTEVIHEVKSSDTLYSVARKYGVTIKEIMDWNEKTDFNIHVGERLKILR